MSRLAVVLAAATAGACGGDDGGPAAIDAAESDGRIDGGPPDARGDGLGSVSTVPGSCSNGNLPRTTCHLLSVECSGIPDRMVEVRVSEPPGGVTLLGTVMFGTGGGGGSHYEQDSEALAMLQRLQAAGFRIVQRQWFGAQGWIEGPGGFAALSCRYASVATWVYETIHVFDQSAGFCVTGNSGGASEVAYALARWNRGVIFDLAVPTGGPPMGRIDRGCLDGADAGWLAECAALVPGGASTCTGGPACEYAAGARMLIDSAYTPQTHCADVDQGFRSTFLDDSAAGPGAALDYPSTRVHFLFGDSDCTEAVPLGLAYAAEITSEKQIDFVANTPHATFSTPEGATAIEAAITTGCVPRP
jgi:hypothetical protein